MTGYDIRVSGPLFDGRARATIRAFEDEAEYEVAQEGVNRVRDQLDSVLQHPTGYYKSRVTTEQRDGGYVITDSRVIYGPWLEGVSSRNQSTRFKGYATFRKVKQDLQADAADIAKRVLFKYLRRLS